MPVHAPSDTYTNILKQIDDNCAILFLGAGSTRNCRTKKGETGLTGKELADEILTHLNGGTNPSLSGVTLTEAAEYYVANHPKGRKALDEMIVNRLKGLKPTIGHRLAATFPWRAVITTNYNEVVEDTWGEATNRGYAARDMLVIRTDEDVGKFTEDLGRVPVFKPHGCISLKSHPKQKMVITSRDYLDSEELRKAMYARIRDLARDNTTVFVGYSLADYTFRNIFYRLFSELGEWTMRSFNVGPVSSALQFQWMSRSFDANFKTTLVDDHFDTFMLRLAKARGTLPERLRDEIAAKWADIQTAAGAYADGLDVADFTSLPDP